MAYYRYKAIGKDGKAIKGEIEAANELEASTNIARQGYIPVSIAYYEKGASWLARFRRPRLKKVSTKSIIIFTRQFATIVKAAVPIIEGLGVLAEQTEDNSLKKALHAVSEDIQQGQKLSEAMSKHPNVFSELYVNSVMAGEAGGVLDKILLRLADVMEEEDKTNNQIKSALRYPIMVVIALFVAIIIFSVKVVPAFSNIYAGFGAKLPLPTQVMIFISNVLQGPWKDSPNLLLKLFWYVLIALAFYSIFQLWKFFISTPKGRWWWDGRKFTIPIVGPVYNRVVMLRFASMFNVLYQAGIPILRIMDIVKVTIGNVVLAKEIDKVKHDVADGKGVSGGVLGSKLFPRLVGYMISIGEKTGSLPMMLDSLCEYFSLEVKTSVQTLTSLIEPIMTLVLGVVVAFMALAVFLPMWDLISVVRQAG